MAQTSISAKSLREIEFNIKMQLKNKGQNSTKALQRNFFAADIDRSGYLDREEFERALSLSGIFLSKMDTNYLMRHFDKNKDGRISIQEFLEGFIPPLSNRRTQMVNLVFDQLDIRRADAVTLDWIFRNFNATNHPDVACGFKSEEEIIQKFLDTFESANRGENGIVTRADFLRHYREISASYPHDEEAFIRMMEEVWGVSGAPLQEEESIDSLEIMLKDKIRLRIHESETEEEVMMRFFKFVDTNENGVLSPEEFKDALARLGLQLNNEEVVLFFEKYDLDRSGALDYREFSRAISGLNEHVFSRSMAHSLYARE